MKEISSTTSSMESESELYTKLIFFFQDLSFRVSIEYVYHIRLKTIIVKIHESIF